MTQAANGFAQTLGWLPGNALKEVGWENNPFANLAEAQQQIADATTHEIRRVPQLRESIEHLQRVRIDVLAGNTVVSALADHGRALLGTEFT